MTLGDSNICSDQWRLITTLRVRVAKMSGFGDCRFAATRTMFIKLLSLGIDWAMLIKSSSIQTTVVQQLSIL